MKHKFYSLFITGCFLLSAYFLRAQVDTAMVITNSEICNGGHNASILYNITGGPGPVKYSWGNGVNGYATGSCTYTVNLNNPGAALSQFQVQVNVTLAAGINADFSNITFLDSVGNLYPFWLTDFPTATTATFWVRVPNIPAGNSVFYLSFCGTSTISQSNPNATFEFFDNFDAGSIAAYTGTCVNIDQSGESCSSAISNSTYFSPGYSAYLQSASSCFSAPFDGAAAMISRTVPMVNDSLVIDYEDMAAVTLYGFCTGGTTTTNTVFADNNNLGNGWSISQGGNCITNTSTWRAETSLPFAVTTGSTTLALQTYGGDCDNSQGWFDDVRVRKYRANPPVVTFSVTPQLALDSLVAGTYTLTLTDINGVVVTRNIVITQPTALQLTTDSLNNPCNGPGHGLAWINIAGGTQPYSILWSNHQTTDTIMNLGRGTYTVTVTDNNMCSATDSTHILQLTVLHTSAAQDSATCLAASTGSAWAVAGGGQAPYTYAWNITSTTDTITALAAGTYTVTVTDINACTASATVTVKQPAADILTTATNPITCPGLSNGKAWATTTGGAAPYSYVWSNTANTDTIFNLAVGTYTVTGTDNNGCSATGSAAIIVSQAQTVAVTSQVTPACSDSANGAVALLVSGGTAPYNYQWSNGDTTQNINGVAAGSLVVTVTDASGCTATSTGTVVNQNLSVTIAALPDSLILSGTQATLTLNGTNIASAMWQPAVSYVDTAGLSVIVSPAASTIYNVVATSTNGCKAYASVKITVEQKPQWLIPTGFSPNGDGMNDVFHVILRGPVELVSLAVFNRWGERVFETDDFTIGWDGTFKGLNQPIGVYIYQITLRNNLNGENKLVNEKGNVTLIR